jgi:transposase-like protein
MLPGHIKSLRHLIETFPTEQSCIEYLEYRRWNGSIRSPFVEGYGVWKCKDGKYRCRKTQKYFTVRTGTIFEKTKIPLRDWFVAVWHMTHYKKGISSIALAGELGVTQKTAWFMGQKIRRIFAMESEEVIEEQGIYELDEACFGGLQKNRHSEKKIPNSQGGHGVDKTWVFGIIQRNGLLRALVMPGRDVEFAQALIRKYIAPNSVIITDAWKGYTGLNDEYHHYIVKDGKQIARNYNPEVHTNNIEGAWKGFKCGYKGIYNWWSKKHLQFYLNEFVYRYNTRKMNTFERLNLIMGNIFRKVTYNDIMNTSWT